MKQLFLVAFAVTVTAIIVAAASAGNDNDAQVLNEISGYRQWTKVNADPVKVEVPVTKTDAAIPLGEALV